MPILQIAHVCVSVDVWGHVCCAAGVRLRNCVWKVNEKALILFTQFLARFLGFKVFEDIFKFELQKYFLLDEVAQGCLDALVDRKNFIHAGFFFQCSLNFLLSALMICAMPSSSIAIEDSKRFVISFVHKWISGLISGIFGMPIYYHLNAVYARRQQWPVQLQNKKRPAIPNWYGGDLWVYRFIFSAICSSSFFLI